MNKSELIATMAEKAKITRAEARAALDAATEAIAEALAAGDKVSILGFGTFSINEKAERTGINPRTKESITIAARKAIKFKAGSEITEKIK